jgi:cytochrome c556
MYRTLVIASLAITPVAAIAQDMDALAVIKSRQEIMSYIGGNMRNIAGMAQGKTDFDAAYVKAYGSAVAAMSSATDHLFPAGTETGGETEAAPAIFTDMAGFVAKRADLTAAAANLAAATDVFELEEAFGAYSATCKACHSMYRVDK